MTSIHRKLSRLRRGEGRNKGRGITIDSDGHVSLDDGQGGTSDDDQELTSSEREGLEHTTMVEHLPEHAAPQTSSESDAGTTLATDRTPSTEVSESETTESTTRPTLTVSSSSSSAEITSIHSEEAASHALTSSDSDSPSPTSTSSTDGSATESATSESASTTTDAPVSSSTSSASVPSETQEDNANDTSSSKSDATTSFSGASSVSMTSATPAPSTTAQVSGLPQYKGPEANILIGATLGTVTGIALFVTLFWVVYKWRARRRRNRELLDAHKHIPWQPPSLEENPFADPPSAFMNPFLNANLSPSNSRGRNEFEHSSPDYLNNLDDDAAVLKTPMSIGTLPESDSHNSLGPLKITNYAPGDRSRTSSWSGRAPIYDEGCGTPLTGMAESRYLRLQRGGLDVPWAPRQDVVVNNIPSRQSTWEPLPYPGDSSELN